MYIEIMLILYLGKMKYGNRDLLAVSLLRHTLKAGLHSYMLHDIQ